MISFTNGFNPANLKDVRESIAKALAGAVPGVDFQVGKITYSGTNCTIKVEANIQGQKTREQETLEMYAKTYGFDVTQEKSHPSHGACRLVGFNPRARTTPWIVECAKGRYRFHQELVQQMWGNAKH